MIWPMVATLVAWPLTKVTASSTPWNSASRRSSAAWNGRSPATSRLAETEVPKVSIAALAAAATAGWPFRPR
jgi:hypothetical protein